MTLLRRAGAPVPAPRVRPRRRGARRFAAALGVAATVVPLAAWGGAPAAAVPLAAPAAGRLAADPEDGTCDPAVFKLIETEPPALLQLGYEQVRTVATGRGVVVAVVDSGVDGRNVHFPSGVVLPGQDLTPAGTGSGQTDTLGHGTAVAGEIAARPYPGSGVVGLAPEATILPLRVYTTENTDGGSSSDGTPAYPPSVEGISAGIITAANSGAKVINVSMSTPSANEALEGAVRYATAKGALVVASAGNRNTSDDKTNTPRYPGAYPDALAVAAVDGSGNVTDDSIHGSYIDVAAPGVDISTTYLNNGDCQLATDNASTSYATAYVSATAALIAEAHPDETPAQWRYRLEATALRVRPDTRDDNAGWGIIQPWEALTYVFDGSAVGPPDPVATVTSTPTPVARQIDPVAAPVVDTTDRDQTLWLTLGGVVGLLLLALVALLRRDRKKPPVTREPRTPAGVR